MADKPYKLEAAMRDAQKEIDAALGRKKKRACECRNHMGSPKQPYKTKESALSQIIRKHAWTGKTYRVYQCPTSNRFHITSRGHF